MKVFSAEEFGEAIRARRKKLGYTQAELADFCACSVTFLSDLENGKPTAELGKALHILGVLSMDVLLETRGNYTIKRNTTHEA